MGIPLETMMRHPS